MLHLLASIEIHFTIVRSLWLIKTPGEDKNTCMPIKLPYLSNWDKKSGDLEELRKKSNPFQFPFIQRERFKEKNKG
jgi:hypothetical protein